MDRTGVTKFIYNLQIKEIQLLFRLMEDTWTMYIIQLMTLMKWVIEKKLLQSL